MLIHTKISALCLSTQKISILCLSTQNIYTMLIHTKISTLCLSTQKHLHYAYPHKNIYTMLIHTKTSTLCLSTQKCLRTHRIDLSNLIFRTSPFPNLGVCLTFIFIFKLIEHPVSKQRKILIRHHIMWCLICVYTVCLCPIKRMLGLYGLIR